MPSYFPSFRFAERLYRERVLHSVICFFCVEMIIWVFSFINAVCCLGFSCIPGVNPSALAYNYPSCALEFDLPTSQ